MVGGNWLPDSPDHCFLSLEEDRDISRINRAAAMLEMICWDPCAQKKHVLSVCSLPLETNFSGPGATIRGCWFMLEVIGGILQQSGSFLKAIVFDAHGSHSVIRRVLFGQIENISKEDLERVPFWKDLVFKPLPKNSLPRLPIQICFHQGEAFYGIPGVCHLQGFIVNFSLCA